MAELFTILTGLGIASLVPDAVKDLVKSGASKAAGSGIKAAYNHVAARYTGPTPPPSDPLVAAVVKIQTDILLGFIDECERSLRSQKGREVRAERDWLRRKKRQLEITRTNAEGGAFTVPSLSADELRAVLLEDGQVNQSLVDAAVGDFATADSRNATDCYAGRVRHQLAQRYADAFRTEAATNEELAHLVEQPLLAELVPIRQILDEQLTLERQAGERDEARLALLQRAVELLEHLPERLADLAGQSVRHIDALSTSLPADDRYQLQPVDPLFVGRDRDLDALEAQVCQSGARVVGIFGMGGLGKTTLARALAHRLAPHFPDAQIEIDLQGFTKDATPLERSAIYAHVIRAFDRTADTSRPVNELAATYTAITRDLAGILLLDNARNAAQISRLLPPQTWLVIVTSRDRFALPKMHAPGLSALPPLDAQDLLLSIAPRIGDHSAALAEQCQRVPAALRWAAGVLAAADAMSPQSYLKRLQAAGGRIEMVLDMTLELSVEALSADLQARWYALSVFPGDFDVEAAAAVWRAGDRDAATADLARLHQASLVEFIPATERYRLHDLARDLCLDRCPSDAGEEAAARHAAHFSSVLAHVHGLYLRGGENVLAALNLFDREWPNVHAGQAWAAAHADTDDEAARLAIRYPHAGVYVLSLRQHPRERIVWLEAALMAARRCGDRRGEGAALGNLGIAYRSLGETRRAIGYHKQHLTIARGIGDRSGEGKALGNLGNAYASRGEVRRAINYYQQHLAIAREIGERRGEGNALANLGNAFADLGDLPAAIQSGEAALAIFEAIEDPDVARARQQLATWRAALPQSEAPASDPPEPPPP